MDGASDKFSGYTIYDISAIDARLAELDKEEERLLALREELHKSQQRPPAFESFSPDQLCSQVHS